MGVHLRPTDYETAVYARGRAWPSIIQGFTRVSARGRPWVSLQILLQSASESTKKVTPSTPLAPEGMGLATTCQYCDGSVRRCSGLMSPRMTLWRGAWSRASAPSVAIFTASSMPSCFSRSSYETPHLQRTASHNRERRRHHPSHATEYCADAADLPCFDFLDESLGA